MQAERGEHLGGRPPYGYRKKSLDSKEIVPDEDTAPIVQRIFQLCAGGKGPNQIARILTEEQILTPANYAYQKEGKSHNHVDITRPYDWSGSSVTSILDNRTYLGHTVGLRSISLSYKNKKLIRRPEDEQIKWITPIQRWSARSCGTLRRMCGSTRSASRSRWRSRISSLGWRSAPTVASSWCSTGPAR